jgi:primary-amine oxidase
LFQRIDAPGFAVQHVAQAESPKGHEMKTLLSGLLALLVAVWLAQAPTVSAQGFQATHPMDALTPDEVKQAVRLLTKAGHVDKKTLYPTMTLYEAPKSEILAWQPGKAFSRKAFVVTHQNSKTHEAVIDLTANKIISHKEIVGAEPAILTKEWNLARDLTFADPRWKAAMKKRGITSNKGILCTPLSAGFFESDPNAGRRLLKVPCYDSRDNIYPTIPREIEGVIAVVDTNAKKVVEVIDSGQIVSMPPVPDGYGKKSPPVEPPLFPVVQDTPGGSNIKISGAVEIGWRNWSFHVRADRRAGAILSLIKFKDGDKKRLVAYQMNISEMFVPYMDPDPTWEFRTYLDAGEFGLGYLVSSLKPGVDCPETAFFVDLIYPSDRGGVYKAPRALCVFERSVGDPAWRHWDVSGKKVDGRPEIELVVRMMPTVGNYDYISDYIFQARGNIMVRVGASGFVAVKSADARNMESPNAAKETQNGVLVAPYTVAPYHDHYINYRIDLDVDGPKNNFVRDFFTRVPLQKPNRRRGIWNLTTVTQKTESPITACTPNVDGAVWRVENQNKRTPLLKNIPSYELMPWHTVTSLMPPNDPAQTRAQFTSSALWMTKFKPRELWASGDYPNLAKKDTGLPVYAGDRESIDNEDIVLWYTAAFHHIPRPEDFQIMPTMWFGFTLRPVRFFDRNMSSLQNPKFK